MKIDELQERVEQLVHGWEELREEIELPPCTWKISESEYITPHGWRHSTVDLAVRYFKFCPYCGGRIKIEGGQDDT